MSENRLNAPPSGVTVRMYRQGLGDCFLLAFPTSKAGEAYFVLIDCGVIFGTADPKSIMTRVMEDIVSATGGEIHLLIITHEHWDHVSGFLQASDVVAGLRVHNLWFAWTEDPSDDLANQLRKSHGKDREALRLAVSRASDASALEHVTNILQFFGDHALAAVGVADTGAALKAVRNLAQNSGTQPVYRHPGEGPLSLPNATNRSEVEGVRLYILGPPHDERTLKHIDATAAGKEIYTEADVPTPARAFQLAVLQEDSLSDGDRFLREKVFPFNKRIRLLRADAENLAFFQEHYGFANRTIDQSVPTETGARPAPISVGPPTNGTDPLAWRRIDDDWLASAGELALQLDSYTNNTSMVLAIELVSSGKVLLFVGDAQVGNWLSWDALAWTAVDKNGQSQKILPGDLLQRTVLYKVGHHGSSNATIRASGATMKGLELMTQPDLVAMIPVDHAMAVKKRWVKMPFDPLLRRLQEKTKQRVMRVDDQFPKPMPEGMGDSVWVEFKKQFEETELYLQFTVID